MFFQSHNNSSYLVTTTNNMALVYKMDPDQDTEAPFTGENPGDMSNWSFNSTGATQIDPPRTFRLLRGVNAAGKSIQAGSSDTIATITRIESCR